MIKRIFQTRAPARDKDTDQRRKNELLDTANKLIALNQTEIDGLTIRYKLAQQAAGSILHALDTDPNNDLEIKLNKHETEILICEKRLHILKLQSDFLKALSNSINLDFPMTLVKAS